MDVRPQCIKITSTRRESCFNHGRNLSILEKRYADKEICPYCTLQTYLQTRGSKLSRNEPFFIFRDRSPLPPSHMQSILREMLHRAGFNQSLYDVHSLRIGRASDLLKTSVLISLNKKLGHWKSNCVYEYLRP